MTARYLPAALTGLALVVAACTPGSSTPSVTAPDTSVPGDDPAAEDVSYAGVDQAPEFPPGLDWLNTGGQSLTLAGLQGKVVLLDFWTYGCINCIHIIPDLERLEEEFAEELVVIGVHSAKFSNEAATDNIRQVILRYGLAHPVVNDHDFETWRQWGANAWPTVALIDPAGNVVGVRSGEGVYDAVAPVIRSLVAEFDDRIDRTVAEFPLERDGLPNTILSFPGKVEVDAAGNTVYIADTNHHRVVVASLPGGDVQAVYGSGRPGWREGTGLAARFDSPQGLALSGDERTLYVADTNNHAVRAIDLSSGAVTTVLGTGAQGGYPPAGGLAPDVAIRSPWDVVVEGGTLFVAMAGSHQIWSLDLETGLAGPFSGNGRESDRDGSATEAELAQPSGLALAGDRLFFADSESSSIRVSDRASGAVDTVVGAERGLFEFGDVDGVGTDVRLQHPLGVAYRDGVLYVADTYNSKIKAVDPEAQSAVTLWGGEPGWRDGPAPLFYEPGGLAVAGNSLYVADTNNHVIRVIDLTSGDTTTLLLKGIEAYQPLPDDEGYEGTVVELDTVSLAPGRNAVVIDITLPPGHKVNEEAPSGVSWLAEGDAVAEPPDDLVLTGARFPVELSAEFAPGTGRLTADINLVWCADDAESLCFIEQVRISAPLAVAPGGEDVLRLTHEIELPGPTA